MREGKRRGIWRVRGGTGGWWSFVMRGCKAEGGLKGGLFGRAGAFSGGLKWVGVRWVGYGVEVDVREELVG